MEDWLPHGSKISRVLKEPHFWVFLTIISCGTLLYYADSIPFLDAVESSVRLDLARRSAHRILSILPVAYAAFAFGLTGGLLASIVIAALLLPRVFIESSDADQALIEVAAFLFIGIFVSWLIDVQNREKAQRRQTIESLEWTQGELHSHIEALENEERRLSAINAVLGVVTESLELRQVLGLAANKVRDVMRAEISLLFLLDEEAGELTLEAYYGISDEAVAELRRMKVGESFSALLAQNEKALAAGEASSDEAPRRDARTLEDVQAQLIVPLKSKGKVLGSLCVATRSPREFTAEEVGLLNAIGNAIGVAIENVRLYHKERQISEQLRQSEENYRGLFENATEAISVHGLDGRIIAANRACEQLTGYTREEMASMNISEFLSGQGLKAVQEAVEKQLDGETIEGPYETQLTKRDGTEAIVELMPSLIIRDGQPAGVQAILRDVTEQRRMQENMRFYISQVLKAQESERLRIARELHDDTAQALTGLSRRLDMLASGEKQVSPEIVERLDQLREQTDGILDGVRRFSQDLRPPVLDDLGLLPALKWLAVALEDQDGIAANIRVLGEQHRLPRDVELTLFRIAQEALSNVRKHSQASAVELTVDFSGGDIAMIVADNGKGFELPRSTSDLAASGKLGVMGMQERARLLGGTLTVQSEPDAGTSIIVTVPG